MASPSTLSALQLYEEAVRGGQRCTVRWEDGGTSELPVERWLAAPTQAELELLSRAPAPVLDVGCGAGRLVLALAQQRVPALGVDVAPAAVRLGRERGAPVLEASVFETVPGHGWWASALLLDGSIGIGGDPRVLVHRMLELLRPGGKLLIEVEPPGAPTTATRLRLEAPCGNSEWLPWGRVAADGVSEVAAAAGCSTEGCWRRGERWFAELGAPPQRRSPTGLRPQGPGALAELGAPT
jgi:SAM-dependent methyltransferase